METRVKTERIRQSKDKNQGYNARKYNKGIQIPFNKSYAESITLKEKYLKDEKGIERDNKNISYGIIRLRTIQSKGKRKFEP